MAFALHAAMLVMEIALLPELRRAGRLAANAIDLHMDASSE